MRSKVMSTPSAEDVPLFGGTPAEAEPPVMARVLRAHANAQVSILSFLFPGLVYVPKGRPQREPHVSPLSVSSTLPMPPPGSLVGTLVTLMLMIHVVWLLVAAS